MNKLDPSRQLICHLITGKVAPADPGITAGVWAHLLPIAHAEGLAPLLYSTLQSHGWPAALSQSLRQSLTGAYYASVAHNTLLFSELDRILPALKARNIPAVLVKGAVLAPSLYPDLGLRPMADLDCLVPHSAYPQAVQLLKQLGYQEDAQDQVEGMPELSGYHCGLKGGPGRRVTFELHWGLVSSDQAWYAAPIEWFWEHTAPWGSTAAALQLTPLAHLLYLSAHAFLQHGGSQLMLIWLYDIHLLAQSASVAWDELVAQAAQFRWGGVVGEALRSAQAAFDTRLPAGLLQQLDQAADPAVNRLVAFKGRFTGVRLLYDWYSLLALRGLPRLRYLLGMIFPQPAYIRWRYRPQPSWLWPFYYPYRWLRMLSEGFLALRRGILRAAK